MKRIIQLRVILCTIFLCTVLVSKSQTNNNTWGGLEIGYGIGLSDKGDLYKMSYSDDKMSISTIRAIVGHYIIPQLSVGVGIGLNSYSKPSLNTVPILADFRYHPLEQNKSLIINTNLGYIIATSENEMKGKFLADLSVGYKVCNIKKLSLVPAVGYNYCNYSLKEHSNTSQSRHSLFLKVGILY